MKLKTYNKDNSSSIRLGVPIIRFNAKDGSIALSSELCRRLNLKGDECIQFHQEIDEPKNWYLELLPKQKSDAFSIRPDKNSKRFVLNSSVIAKTFLTSLGLSPMAVASCLVATEPTELEGMRLYPLITNSVKSR